MMNHSTSARLQPVPSRVTPTTSGGYRVLFTDGRQENYQNLAGLLPTIGRWEQPSLDDSQHGPNCRIRRDNCTQKPK